MRRALAPFVCSAFLAAAPVGAAVWTGTSFRVPAVWVGGGAGTGVTSSTRSVCSVGQPAVGGVQVTASYRLRPGFLQPVPAGSFGGGSGIVDPGQERTLTFTTPSGCLQVTVPQGCFGAPVVFSVAAPGALPAADARVGRLNGTPVAAFLSVTPVLVPQKPIAVRACYLPADVTGMNESRLRLAVMLPGDGSWLPLVSSADPFNDRVSAAAPRLGLWRVVEVLPADSPGGVVAFPNPLLPGQGAMTLSNLPAGARLRIYTFSGRPVRELSADETGRTSWDGLTGDGSPAASGTYFVFIDGPGGTGTMKVQVQR